MLVKRFVGIIFLCVWVVPSLAQSISTPVYAAGGEYLGLEIEPHPLEGDWFGVGFTVGMVQGFAGSGLHHCNIDNRGRFRCHARGRKLKDGSRLCRGRPYEGQVLLMSSANAASSGLWNIVYGSEIDVPEMQITALAQNNGMAVSQNITHPSSLIDGLIEHVTWIRAQPLSGIGGALAVTEQIADHCDNNQAGP